MENRKEKSQEQEIWEIVQSLKVFQAGLARLVSSISDCATYPNSHPIEKEIGKIKEQVIFLRENMNMFENILTDLSTLEPEVKEES